MRSLVAAVAFDMTVASEAMTGVVCERRCRCQYQTEYRQPALLQ